MQISLIFLAGYLGGCGVQSFLSAKLGPQPTVVSVCYLAACIILGIAGLHQQ